MSSDPATAAPSSGKPSLPFLAGLTFVLYVLDQVSKWLVRENIALGDMVSVIDGFSYFNHAQNSGIAFGMFNGEAWANLVFGVVAFGAIIGIFFLGKKGAFPGPVSRTAAALLISGILGNVTDRLLRGHVTDFLLFDLQFWTRESRYFFASFNVADSCICVAAGLLILSTFLPEGREAAKRAEADAS